MTDEVVNRLLELAIENNAEIKTLKSHIFNGLTTRVNAVHEKLEKHPTTCPFLEWLNAHPEESVQMTRAREARGNRVRSRWLVAKDVALLGIAILGSLRGLGIL